MTICFICSEYPPGAHGGIGTVTQVLGRALVLAGQQVRVIGVYPESEPGPDAYEDRGVRVYRLRVASRRHAWVGGRVRLFRRVRQWARDREIDLVEVPDFQGWAAGWPALNVPVVTRLHGSATYFAAEMGASVNSGTWFLERASLRRSDRCCSVSRYTAERSWRLFRLRGAEGTVLYNPVEIPTLAAPVSRANSEVVFSGTLTPRKGIVSLIRAWPLVLRAVPRAELHIFGKDGRTREGASMQSWLGGLLPPAARQQVRFHGHVPRHELLAALARARVAVFPSHAEAFAMAPLEAMACGCPTIYSSRGSGPELIAHGRNGLLVDPDSMGELAAAVIRILADDPLARVLGENGRATVRERFDTALLLRQNLAFYQECVNR